MFFWPAYGIFHFGDDPEVVFGWLAFVVFKAI